MDSPRKLVSIYTIDFIISINLIILIDVQASDITWLKINPKNPNSPWVDAPWSRPLGDALHYPVLDITKPARLWNHEGAVLRI
jgi:hypothetical protein